MEWAIEKFPNQLTLNYSKCYTSPLIKEILLQAYQRHFLERSIV
jgi:hypothetical protein